MGGDLVEQQQRRLATDRPQQPGVSEQDRDQQRLLLAGRGELGGDALLGQGDRQIRPVRADRGAAGFGIGAPPGGEGRREPGFGGERRHLVEPALDGAVECQTGARKRRFGLGAGAVEKPHGMAPSGRDRHSLRRHDFFDRREPGRVGRPVRPTAVAQQVGTLAQSLFIGADTGRMRRIESEHEAIEKPPPAAGPFEEEAIHRRRQPDDPEARTELGLAARRLAVDTHDPPFAFHPVPAGADLQRAAPGRDRRGDGPAADRPGRRRCLPFGPAAIDVAEPGAAQPAPRRQKGQGLEQIGLAGAVRAGHHHRFVADGRAWLRGNCGNRSGRAASPRHARPRPAGPRHRRCRGLPVPRSTS